MAVKMRLMRVGKTKSPYYRVVVMDGRAPRDGRYIDLIGRYDPREEPSLVEIDADKAADWLRKGAQPTEAVSKLLEVSGALTEFKVRSGRIHTVGGSAEAEAAPVEEASAEEASTEDASSDEGDAAAPEAEAAAAGDTDDSEVDEASTEDE